MLPSSHSLAFVLAAALALATPGLAQTGRIEHTSAPAAGQPEYTIRTRVPVTIVDIVVTDAKGQPVHDLKQSDFTVFEDGKPVVPKSFEEHRSDAVAAQVAPKLALPPNTFSNAAPVANGSPIDILLIDSLNTPTQVQQIVQQQMLSFVNKMPAGTRVAVLGLKTHLFIVQGITTDRELLKAAITNKKFIAERPPLEDMGQEPPALEQIVRPEVDCDQTALRAQYTIPAMSSIARYVSGMPGRKNLIWFSGSFPLKMPESGSCYDFTDRMTAATDQLSHAHVAIYPVDGRALDSASGKSGSEHFTMELLADQTGGKAAYSTNDLAGAAEAAVDAGANFYTLTYTPTNQTLDTRFRTITIKTSQPGLHLVYRTGYYANDPEIDSRGKQIPKVTPMQTALMRGAPEATQILFKVTAVEAPALDASLPAGNQPNLKQIKPPYRRYTLTYSIDINSIDFEPTPDSNYRGSFEFGAFVYNADGDEIVNSASKTVSPILPPAVYQSMLRSGATGHQEIAVPAKGDYFLRIAVHDLTSDRVGSVEIPVSAIVPEAAP